MTYQWPNCQDVTCQDYLKPLVPGLDFCNPGGARIWHCLSCTHTEPRQPRTALSKRDKAGNRYNAKEYAEALKEMGN